MAAIKKKLWFFFSKKKFVYGSANIKDLKIREIIKTLIINVQIYQNIVIQIIR